MKEKENINVDRSDRKSWNLEEDNAIFQLVQQYGVKKWTTVSKKLEEVYNVKDRSGKQCRERWHNHLDPQILKDPWTQKEEKIIFENHRKFGNKWSEISKYLPGRTDNSIKNHFYSTLRRSLRRINKLLGDKNSTNQVKDIKPGVLSKIFLLAEQNQQDIDSLSQRELCVACKGVQQSLLEFANDKPLFAKRLKDSSEDQESQKMKKQFTSMIEKILNFNKDYKQQRIDKLKRKRIDEQQQNGQTNYSVKNVEYKLKDTIKTDLLDDGISDNFDHTSNNCRKIKQEYDPQGIAFQQQSQNKKMERRFTLKISQQEEDYILQQIKKKERKIFRVYFPERNQNIKFESDEKPLMRQITVPFGMQGPALSLKALRGNPPSSEKPIFQYPQTPQDDFFKMNYFQKYSSNTPKELKRDEEFFQQNQLFSNGFMQSTYTLQPSSLYQQFQYGPDSFIDNSTMQQHQYLSVTPQNQRMPNLITQQQNIREGPMGQFQSPRILFENEPSHFMNNDSFLENEKQYQYNQNQSDKKFDKIIQELQSNIQSKNTKYNSNLETQSVQNNYFVNLTISTPKASCFDNQNLTSSPPLNLDLNLIDDTYEDIHKKFTGTNQQQQQMISYTYYHLLTPSPKSPYFLSQWANNNNNNNGFINSQYK